MAKPDPSPETYLNLTAPTQYELAQRIDAALLAAQDAVNVSQESQCYQLWLQQFYDLAIEELNASLDVAELECAVEKWQISSAFQQAILQLITNKQSSKNASLHAQPSAALQMTVSLLLERSFLDALDFMHGQGSWRFDIQRSMQDICKDLQVYIDSLSS